MYGWRGKIGVLLPSGITVIEGDFRRMLPEGVACHYHRYDFSGGRSGDEGDVMRRLTQARDSIGKAVELLCHVHPDLIVMAGTATTFVGGFGYDASLVELMRQTGGGIPATTTSTSVIAALKQLDVKTISLASPYVAAASRKAADFIESHGIRIADARWLGKAGADIPATSRSEIYQMVRQADRPESDAVFISCTDLNVLELVCWLEQDLGKPIITSNQATMWHMLRLIGVRDRIKGFGRLLTDF